MRSESLILEGMRRPANKWAIICIVFWVPLQVIALWALSEQAVLGASTGPGVNRAELFMVRMRLMLIENVVSFLVISTIVVVLALRGRRS